jgi:hypothetical protein
MFEIKPISLEAVPTALAKAERYRLLNEPAEAASICEDILQVSPNHSQAVIMLILALTDQADQPGYTRRARNLLPRIGGEYERFYYGGLIAERQARAYWRQERPGSGANAYEGFIEAMVCYTKAEALRPPGNDDALLRWNACARALNTHTELRPRPVEQYEVVLDD